MTSETWTKIPGDEINWEQLVVPGMAYRPYDKEVEPTRLKCPKCEVAVTWTEITTEAETCGCGFKWFVAGGTNGGVYIFGTREGVKEIKRLIK